MQTVYIAGVPAGSVLMTGQKAPATEVLGSRKSARPGKTPLPAKYDVLLQLFGESSQHSTAHSIAYIRGLVYDKPSTGPVCILPSIQQLDLLLAIWHLRAVSLRCAFQ